MVRNAIVYVCKCVLVGWGLLFVVGVAVHVSAQESPRINAGNVQITGVPDDWSHHHTVFSDPGSEEDAIRAGRHEDWLRIVNDPRYIMQQLRRNSPVRGPLAEDAAYVQRLKAEFYQAQEEEHQEAVKQRRGNPEPFRHWEPASRNGNAVKADWSVNLTTSSLMPNTYPAMYSFNPVGAPSCTSDFVVYPTGAQGSSAAATILAFNELYEGASGCTAVPSVYWAYNTTIPGTAPGAVTTSPVLSLDGTKIAFIQSTGSAAELIVLKTLPASGYSVSNPVSITAASNNLGCTAPCMTVTPLSSGASDTYSSPYYDYASDTVYVGDDAGYLYRISPVFNSNSISPVETKIQIQANSAPLASPVYDSISGCVFVGDTRYGYLYSVNSGLPGNVCAASAFSLNATSEALSYGYAGQGIFDGVILDQNAAMVYAFVSYSGSVGACGQYSNCVAQFPTNFSNHAAPQGAEALGAGTSGGLYAGTFDNVYFSSANPTSLSGNLWVVGNVLSASASLFRVPIVANAMGNPVATTVGDHNYGWATPVTEFCNNGGNACAVTTGGLCGVGVTCTTAGTDSLYFSIYAGPGSGCSGSGQGCVVAYQVNTATPVLTGTADYAFPDSGFVYAGCWGTSAIIVDNASTAPGASQIYYIYFGGNSPATTALAGSCSSVSGNTSQAIQIQQGTL